MSDLLILSNSFEIKESTIKEIENDYYINKALDLVNVCVYQKFESLELKDEETSSLIKASSKILQQVEIDYSSEIEKIQEEIAVNNDEMLK